MSSVPGFITHCVSSSSSSSLRKVRSHAKKKACRVSCGFTSHNVDSDPYKILSIQRGASESEVKKAFKKLALKMVMNDIRGEISATEIEDEPIDDTMRGMEDPDWDMWEEWMGWEGAGIRDY